MFKTFFVIGENEEKICERLELAISQFATTNHLKEVNRSVGTIGMSPIGNYHTSYMISICVTCAFEEDKDIVYEPKIN